MLTNIIDYLSYLSHSNPMVTGTVSILLACDSVCPLNFYIVWVSGIRERKNPLIIRNSELK